VSPRKKSIGIPRTALLAVALALPALSLIPLGSLWLWQNGFILYWALISCVVVAGIYYLERRLLTPPAALPALEEDTSPGDTRWSPRQDEAWADVKALAANVDPNRLSSRDAVVSLGLETIEVVAKRLHPERGDPLLQFTVPEALAVIEQASGGLRDFVSGSFPLGDRVTVAQLMWLYRWRGALGLVEKGYDLWRIVRLLNPVSAVTQELRERFTRQIYDAGREHLARRLARAFVREVGRAAIDLYGGSLRVSAGRLETHVSAASRRDMAGVDERGSEPIRILVAGQTGSGKSSLVNALANAVEAAVNTVPTTATFTAHKLTHDGLPAALLIDSPGLAGVDTTAALVQAADGCDMVLWVASAVQAARETDRAAIEAIRAHFAARTHRRPPPILLVLTQIDRLRPFSEWEPPYDLGSPTRSKAASIRAAMEAAGDELGFAAEDIVPTRVDVAVAPYNVDALWARIIELAPDAQRARLLRSLSDIKSAAGWGTIWSQAVNAGRVIRGTFLSRSPN
jgi:predicted GTPase